MAGIFGKATVTFPELRKLRQELKDLPKSVRKKYMKAAMYAGAKVGAAKLKQITPRGPTGNLRRAVKAKATANYGLAGYEAKKGGKGSHQGFLEFGTKQRKTKGRIASTFNSKTQGRGGRMQIVIASRGKFAGKLRTKGPGFPKSFFKSAPVGEKVDLKRMPIGGRLGKAPVKTAFEQSRGQIQTVLRQQAATAYDRATKDMARRLPPKGTA
jgi:hypothetical protein